MNSAMFSTFVPDKNIENQGDPVIPNLKIIAPSLEFIYDFETIKNKDQ
jgi:hypothetical protein